MTSFENRKSMVVIASSETSSGSKNWGNNEGFGSMPATTGLVSSILFSS
ncbi:MAG: hypothetical protein ACI9BD_001378 [Candidatus Marinamargulisbacteria bacterium]